MNDLDHCLEVVYSYQSHVNNCVRPRPTFDVKYMSETVRDRGLVPNDQE